MQNLLLWTVNVPLPIVKGVQLLITKMNFNMANRLANNTSLSQSEIRGKQFLSNLMQFFYLPETTARNN